MIETAGSSDYLQYQLLLRIGGTYAGEIGPTTYYLHMPYSPNYRSRTRRWDALTPHHATQYHARLELLRTPTDHRPPTHCTRCRHCPLHGVRIPTSSTTHTTTTTKAVLPPHLYDKHCTILHHKHMAPPKRPQRSPPPSPPLLPIYLFYAHRQQQDVYQEKKTTPPAKKKKANLLFRGKKPAFRLRHLVLQERNDPRNVPPVALLHAPLQEPPQPRHTHAREAGGSRLRA